MSSNLKQRILKRTDKAIYKTRYKTTSFTLLREDYAKFVETCKANKRTPSTILREMVLIFIEDSSKNDSETV